MQTNEVGERWLGGEMLQMNCDFVIVVLHCFTIWNILLKYYSLLICDSVNVPFCHSNAFISVLF